MTLVFSDIYFFLLIVLIRRCAGSLFSVSLQDNTGRELIFFAFGSSKIAGWLRLEHKVRILCEDGRFIRNKKYVDLTRLVLVVVS